MKLPFGKSTLRKAVERGLKNGNIQDEIKDLGDLTIKSRGDAEDICWGLKELAVTNEKLAENVRALAGLFQEVKGRQCAAFEVLQERGIAELLRLYDLLSLVHDDSATDTLLFLLKIFGLYGTPAGTLKIVEAARLPLKPDGYMWSVILRGFTAGHPEKDLLYKSLCDPLPGGFIGVSLLDAANAVLLAGDSMAHPFDSAEGKQRLRDWLSDPDDDHFSYAHSATAALPFISNPGRDALLDLAMKHPERGVQVESAWAAAKIGRDDGIQRLATHCTNFNTAQKARRYLEELGRLDAIPPQANDPGFAALAQFAEWLAHPNELGRAPDELEITDHRELRWPPERKVKPFWLIKYRLRDTTGLEDDDVECGLVGSATFCFFSYKLVQRPPEDAYAVHCYWELEHANLVEESKVNDDSADYASLLSQWNGPPLKNAQLRWLAELSPELGYSQRLVGLASASLNGESGWVVLDGSRSEWYPKSDQPEGAYENVVLKVHVGRQLLGFTAKPDRKKYLSPEKPPKPAEQIIAAYERLLAEAQKADAKKRKQALRSSGTITEHFDQYIDALRSTGRDRDIRPLIAGLEPDWDHPAGYSRLGNAAWKSGQADLAEHFFKKYRENYADYQRGEEMALLAEIWSKAGRQDAARDLLLDCLHRLLNECKTAEGSDKVLFEKWFQNQRAAFLKLFPNDEPLLAARSIPASTLR